MPQHTQHSLIPVLLLWTTILSIIQVVSIILFFTVGRFGLSQNCSTVAQEATMQFHANNETLSTPEFLLGEGKMANFEGIGVHQNKTIEWAEEGSAGLFSGGCVLKILKDGFYFLSLRVTLVACNESENTGQKLDEVSLRTDNKAILKGWIHTKTCSTGVLSKVEILPAGTTLTVTSTSNQTITTTTITTAAEARSTYLSVIFMLKP